MTTLTRTSRRGFTLIEIVVVLAIVGILLALAVPRYLAQRREALASEADESLAEFKNLAWGYYQQYGTWVGLTDANVLSTLGFRPPEDADGCWDYGLAVDGSATQIQMRATGDNTPAKCLPANGGIITLVLYGNGASARTMMWP